MSVVGFRPFPLTAAGCHKYRAVCVCLLYTSKPFCYHARRAAAEKGVKDNPADGTARQNARFRKFRREMCIRDSSCVGVDFIHQLFYLVGRGGKDFNTFLTAFHMAVKLFLPL